MHRAGELGWLHEGRLVLGTRHLLDMGSVALQAVLVLGTGQDWAGQEQEGKGN
jgi:hypothetical protein